MIEQRLGHRFGGGANVQKHRTVRRDMRRAFGRDRGFGLGIQLAALAIGNIHRARGHNRAAMHPL